MHGTHTPPTAKTDPVPNVSGAKTKEFCCIETLEASNPVCPGPSCLPVFAYAGLSPGRLSPPSSSSWISPRFYPHMPSFPRVSAQHLQVEFVLSLLTPARFLSLFGTPHFLASRQLVDILGIVVRLEQVHRGGPLLLCFLVRGSAQCWTQTSALSPHASLPALPMADITSCSFLPSLIQPQTLS